jgi:hypothetical protein
MGLITGADTVAAIGKFKVYRTTNFDNPSGSGGPTWDAKDLTGADEMLTWVVDPFSPGYITGVGTVDGWAATTTKLYRLADLFGTTPTATAVVTFANTASWRTIQASFGTYYPAGQNPWLICVSYYGSTGGHTGTWATYSIDGGTTWAAEVQVSAFYDSGGAVNAIGLYCSPKTPGLAYTAAHLATANPATSGGFVSTDWGATWTAMPTSDDPATPSPLFGSFSGSQGIIGTIPLVYDNNDVVQPSFSASDDISGTNLNIKQEVDVFVAIPADAKQVTISGHFAASVDWAGFGSAGHSFTPSLANGGVPLTRTIISDTNNGATGNHSSYTRDFTFRYNISNYATADWPRSREYFEALSGTPVYGSDTSVRFSILVLSNATGSSTVTSSLTLTVDEIVLDDGTTYIPQDPGIISPVNSQAGELHLPWPDNDAENVFYYGALNRTGNRLFDLKRAVAGTLTGISPNDGTRDFGINHNHFAVRTFDGDRSYVVAAVTGNDTTSGTGGDYQAVYVSSDAGDTWTNIVTHTNSTEPYSAAFGGDDQNILYVWGPASYIKYSSNFGSSLDDRSGNLTALSATHIIGIAGGATG